MRRPTWPEGKLKFQFNGYVISLHNGNFPPFGTKAYITQRTKSQGQEENLFVS